MLYNVFLVKIAFEKPHPLRFFQKKKKKKERKSGKGKAERTILYSITNGVVLGRF